MRFPLKVQLVDSLAEFGRTRSLVVAGLLTGAAVIIDRLFTFEVSPVLEIGFAFLATALCAALCGPWVAGTAGVAVDLLSYFLRPNGAFFFGFTFNHHRAFDDAFVTAKIFLELVRMDKDFT